MIVLLRPSKFHHHRSGWLPPNQHRHCGLSGHCLLRLSIPQCSMQWSSNAASFDPVWNVNARRVGDTACPPPVGPLPNSRDSVSTTVQLRGADFARHTCFCAGVVDHVRPSPQPNRAGRGDLNTPVLTYGRLCHLPPADAMIDITQVVLL